MGDVPRFATFYRAVNGRDPFPWQARLATQVEAEGWPVEIGVPTGLGKTAAIDIAVWALAIQADRDPAQRTAPTRIWYVVNRRLLVDAGSERAQRLSDLLANPSLLRAEGRDSDQIAAVAAVAERLASMPATRHASGPLFVSRLRGGIRAGGRPPEPSYPAVICATVPMFGSRLLFRGYGASNLMWPIDAALAGSDSLILLDEAHLAQPLHQLIRLLPDCDANRTGVLRVAGRAPVTDGPAQILPVARAYPLLVSLTATGQGGEGRFDLDDVDRGHPIIRRRLTADKPTSLVETGRKQLPEEIAGQLSYLLGSLPVPGSGVAFVNSPRTAREVAGHLGRGCDRLDAEVVVLTGQLRDPDADEVRRHLLDPRTGVPASRDSQQPRKRHLAVVSTQTLEVGADVDFDVLVTESAGVRALTQRLGRLNRLGVRPHARAVIVHSTDQGSGGLYGNETAELWTRLQALGQPLDLSPGSISTLLGAPQDAPPFIPELLPAHLWEFAKTSLPPLGAAPPEVFYQGLEEAGREVSVVWRAEDPAVGEQLAPHFSQTEAADVPIWEARQFLQDRGIIPKRLDHDGAVEEVSADAITPGDRIVLPAQAGGYATTGWDPDATDEVLDLSPLLRHTLHLDGPAVANLLGRPLSPDEQDLLGLLALSDDDTPDPDQDAHTAQVILDWLRSTPRPAVIPDNLWPFAQARQPAVSRMGAEARLILTWILPVERGLRIRVEALDELSLARSVALSAHLDDVARMACEIGRRLGLPPNIIGSLGQAGRWHDLGKADPRFQRALDALPEQLLAKSSTHPATWGAALLRSGWPAGGRHELVSLQLLAATSSLPREDADLARHLILSHHGYGRPLCPVAEEGKPVATSITVDGRQVTAQTDPCSRDWQQADRFRELSERYGHWGLALLETVLRQADHTVSAIAEVQ